MAPRVARAGSDGDDLVGVGLVLYRQLPKVKRYLAYLPEGPVIDWAADDLARLAHPDGRAPEGPGRLRGPDGPARGHPALGRRGGQGGHRRRGGTPPRRRAPDRARPRPAPAWSRSSHELGWQPQAVEGGFAAGQPQYNFQIPLRDADGAPRTEDDVLKGMNQLWRRNIKKAAKAGSRSRRRRPRDGPAGVPRPLRAHRRARPLHARARWPTSRPCSTRCSAEEPDRIRLYLARHEGDLVAATICVRVGGHAWYSYGASSTEKRDVRGSNAVQWAMIRDALAAGADVYDLRGITDTLDADDPHVGLIQFKVGTGGEAVEYAGEWDLPLNRAALQGVRRST